MRIAVAGGTGLLGQKTVAAVARRGHEPVVLARSTGVDLLTGAGAARALDGVDAVVDALGVATLDAARAVDFFERTTRSLLIAEEVAEVPHHVAVSIVGVDRAPYGYYAGKMAQERILASGPVPWTILRATQFHEFARQMYVRARVGPLHLAPRMRTQPVSADEVADRLVTLAERPAAGRARDLAGPREESLVEMVRAYARSRGRRGWIPAVSMPGELGRAQRDGRLLPDADSDRGTQTFAQWLAG
ncbi:SDR family oxidoreductase [Microbacterium sp. GXF7504]